ncbi:hypothetical protein RhiirC2_789399 [Rhizophagus irregularis]|uniref:Uncharacterized protein n=1 Tax=Rhizophagus irregularis TaxID=588596 RepID=A0A2N1MN82_9GLOM|nr:hypothetical protein RhiirC2_789399 [Rhizophagus irregularis]
MSSKNYGQKLRRTQPCVQKIRPDSRRIKRNPPKLYPNCKETNKFVNLLFSKINKIEEVINNFENFFKKTTQIDIDDPFEYALYCSSDWDPMELDQYGKYQDYLTFSNGLKEFIFNRLAQKQINENSNDNNVLATCSDVDDKTIIVQPKLYSKSAITF